MIRASIHVNLAGVVPSRQRQRVAVLHDAPAGAHAIVYIGNLSVEPATVRALLEHVVRLDVELRGASPRAVRRWLDACHMGGTI